VIDAETRKFVRKRAGGCCEYCRLPQQQSELAHHIEHIVARQHGGQDARDNLALACSRCNRQKGPNLSGIDPVSHDVVALFHPRRERWDDHFVMREARVDGLTATGRATVHLLAMNNGRRVPLRTELARRGKIQ
jgi:5-methylcytosine-specific restriction endonuclease McrA